MAARTRPRHAAMIALAVALIAGTTSCGDDDTSDLPPPASPPGTTGQTPGQDLSPAEQQAVDEAQAKFDEFMNAYITVSTADVPTPDEAEDLFAQVDQHVGGGELSGDLRVEIVGRWGEQRIMNGDLGWTFVDMVGVDLDREVDGTSFPQVSLRYCIDSTAWVPTEAQTGEPVGEAGEQHLWQYAVSWNDDWGGLGQGPDGWRVREREELKDQPC